MIGHISADVLASYRAGAVRPGRAARISAHLTSCSRCADVESKLASVSMLLASVSLPSMPDSLTQRLMTTLTEESARRTTVAQSAAAPGRAVDPRPAGRRTWGPRIPDWSSPVLVRSLTVTGVLALIVAGGVVLASLGTSTPESVSAKPANPAGAPAPRPQTKALPTGTNSNDLGSLGTLPVHYRYQGSSVTTNVVVSNVNYTKSDLAAGVRASLSAPVDAPASGPPAGPAARGLGGVSARQLSDCLSRVAAGHRILLAEVAHYLAGPATIVVLKPIGPIFHVIVVGAACSATDADVVARLSLPKS